MTKVPGSAREHSGGLARLKSSWSHRAADGLGPAAILDSLDAAVVARRPDGVISSWNLGAERLHGYSASEMIGRTFDVIVPRLGRGWDVSATRASLLAGLSDSYESERVSKDGEEKQVQVQITPVTDTSGAITGVSTIEWNIDASAADGPRISTGETCLQRAFEDAPIGIALVSVAPASAERILRVNRAFCGLIGYPAARLEGTDVRELLHSDDGDTDAAAMAQLNGGDLDRFQLEQRVCHAEHHVVWVTVSASMVRSAQGHPLYCIRQLQDIEERKRHEGELGYLVDHDPLTGLLNRRGFLRELTHEMAYSRRYGGGGAVLFLDLDDFKWINDTLGHAIGDEVIIEVARILNERLRDTDAIGRLGGDEFAVLLPHTPPEQAQSLSADLVTSVRDGCAVSLPGGRRVTVSVGVNQLEEHTENVSAEDILEGADSAMYSAKEVGKDRVAVASATTHEQIRDRATWAERVGWAVRDGLFELYCQPIVDLARSSVSQWELLLRLPGDGGELIPPAKFLCVAERSGLILEIDRWVVGQALSLIAGQRDKGRSVRVEVNISGRSVGDPRLLASIEQGLEEAGIDPASLVLEVTETAAIANMDRARGFASKLKALGCGFALDDFGAGFGSFSYLKHIPFDYVKIDGEFVRNLPASSTDRLIIDSIVQMCEGLGMRTIAEFVGDSETVALLKAQGVDYGQGFYLGKPVPVRDVLPV
jgi:diguanylate cyclase (GGDEF)-like protein/PAS domain S-box-containing protein